jgi:hypothetical protein
MYVCQKSRQIYSLDIAHTHANVLLQCTCGVAIISFMQFNRFEQYIHEHSI